MTREARQVIGVRIALIVAIGIVFGRIVTFGPVNWDDRETIFANAAMRTGDAFADAWGRPHLSLWIPVTHTLWATLATIGGAQASRAISAVPFRVASLALHATATLLVFAIVRRLRPDRLAPAAIAASVFALHPLQVESVAWISGQKDVLAGTLTFAATLAAMRSIDRPSRMAIALGVAAMLAKPQAVVVVALLPIVLRRAGASRATAWRSAAWLAGPAVVVAIVAKLAQPAPSVAAVALWRRPIVTVDALAFYATKLVWPTSLAVDYGRVPSTVLDARHAAVGVAVVGAIACVAFLARHRLPCIGIGLSIATIALAPVLGLVPFEFQIYSTVADHYVYTAMLGISIAVVAIVERCPDRFAWIGGVALAIVLGAISFAQVGVWRETTTLFTRALRVTPTSLAADRVLASEAAERGDDARAIDLLHAALRDHPADPAALFNLANALARVGRLDEARAAFATLTSARPGLAAYRHNYAIVLVRLGEVDAAIAQLRIAIALDPRATQSRAALATLESLRSTSRPTSLPTLGRRPITSPMNIAVMPGDYVGKEVVAEGLKILEFAGRRFGFDYTTQHYPHGAEHYLKTKETLPDGALRELGKADAILFGAVGADPRGNALIPQGLIETDILLKMRFEFDQYINLRPTKLLPGVPTPIKAGDQSGAIDMVIVRENTEGLYCQQGGFLYKGTPHEVANQIEVCTRHGVERAIRYAFEYAVAFGRKKVTLVAKTNVLRFAHNLWMRAFEEVKAEYPQIATDYHHVDACTMYMVTKPSAYDVIVTTNMFGDIITDLGAAIQGGMGMAASGNLNPTRKHASMFEPVHGSAPDIAGKGVANPIATFLSVAMMLDFLDHKPAAEAIKQACADVVADPANHTADLRGTAKMEQVTAAVLRKLAV